MQALMQSIYARFAAMPHTPLWASVQGRLYDTEAPERAAMPYIVMTLVSDVSTPFADRCEVQFSIVSNRSSAEEAERIRSALIALYDDCDLPGVGTPNNLGLERTHATRVRDGGLWLYHITYEIWIAKL